MSTKPTMTATNKYVPRSYKNVPRLIYVPRSYKYVPRSHKYIFPSHCLNQLADCQFCATYETHKSRTNHHQISPSKSPTFTPQTSSPPHYRMSATELQDTHEGIGESSSVDDLFTKLSIPEIQKISREYKQHVDRAKNDLHTLVGTKYRDLIKIAEDIDYMYTLGIETDQKLAELSYKPSKFVSFTNNTTAKFDTSIRMKNAADARTTSKLTILRNIINNKLVKLDLKMTSLSTTRSNASPVTHTSNLIYYAKVYFTVEMFFKDILQDNKHIMAQFQQSKQNFIAYIESQLASYNVLNSSYSSKNDRFRPSQDIKYDDLVNQQILIDGDSYDEEYDEEYEEDDYDDFENEETVHSSFEANRNVEPLLNYLISYIIINSTNPELDTISKVVDKFMALRIKHLKLMLESLVSKQVSTRVNFLSIFKYVENTCTYVDKYFSRNSEMLRELTSYTKPWEPSSLVGFRGWLDADTISFNQEVYVHGLSSSSEPIVEDSFKILADTVFKFTSSIMKTPPNSKQSTQLSSQLSTTLVIFHNFIISLKSLHDTMMLHDTRSKFLALVIDSKILSESMNHATSEIMSTFAGHFSLLSSDSESSILSIMKLGITSPINHTKLFSKELVDIMADDLEGYVNVINKLTVSTENNACSTLLVWFDSLAEYYDLTNIKKEQYKLTPSSSLSHLYTSISKLKEPWGEFSSTTLESEFTDLRSRLYTTFWQHINNLVSRINHLLKEIPVTDMKGYYYILEIFITLKNRILELPDKNIFELSDKSDAKDTVESMDAIVTTIYQNIIEQTPKKSFEKSLGSHISKLLLSVDQEIPSRPSLFLTSLMYKLSTDYISIDPKSNNQFGHLFLDKSFEQMFIELKDAWVKSVIEGIVMKMKAKSSEKEAKIEEEVEVVTNDSQEEVVTNDSPEDVANIAQDTKSLPTSYTKFQAQSILAEIIYLLHFSGSKNISESTQEYVEIFNELLEEEIDKVVPQIILKSVGEVYKSHKNIYLPLLK